ncbi:MAG: hypothetical protein FIB07_12450 [Candidatus Methanoperedens sp.]|nr:hypothetical protein [Candidatus Methanoperedens sp.]
MHRAYQKSARPKEVRLLAISYTSSSIHQAAPSGMRLGSRNEGGGKRLAFEVHGITYEKTTDKHR